MMRAHLRTLQIRLFIFNDRFNVVSIVFLRQQITAPERRRLKSPTGGSLPEEFNRTMVTGSPSMITTMSSYRIGSLGYHGNQLPGDLCPVVVNS